MFIGRRQQVAQAILFTENNGREQLSTGKLVRYFFSQISVTILLLVIFEAAATESAPFVVVENFIAVQCAIMIVDLLSYLCKGGSRRGDDDFEGQQARREHPCLILFSVAVYLFEIAWLIYGNIIYLQLPEYRTLNWGS